jgi:hypothetical protein
MPWDFEARPDLRLVIKTAGLVEAGHWHPRPGDFAKVPDEKNRNDERPLINGRSQWKD